TEEYEQLLEIDDGGAAACPRRVSVPLSPGSTRVDGRGSPAVVHARADCPGLSPHAHAAASGERTAPSRALLDVPRHRWGADDHASHALFVHRRAHPPAGCAHDER